MNLALTTYGGKNIRCLCRLDLFSRTLNEKNILTALSQCAVAPEDVCSMELSANDVEIEWGKQFASFGRLRELRVIADNRIRMNCFNLEQSRIQVLHLQAPEIWFNDGALMNADNLTCVHIQGRILDGQHHALTELLFQNCINLTHIYGTYHGDRVMPCVFENCSKLEVPLDLYVKDLGYHTFSGCTSLKRIHLHNGMEAMGCATFKNCTSLEDIYIPDTVRDLGYETFSGCTNLKRIHLPDNIKSIPFGFLADCRSLAKCYIPSTVEKIDPHAFVGCSGLTAPFMPSALKEIGSKAFWGCTSFQQIYLPETISSIGEDAFGNCPGLIIKGKKGTLAEEYASNHQIRFEEAR